MLSHQFKIASKLELFVGASPDGERPSYQVAAWVFAQYAIFSTEACYAAQKCRFKRLGYLSLDNNERSSYQARVTSPFELALGSPVP